MLSKLKYLWRGITLAWTVGGRAYKIANRFVESDTTRAQWIASLVMAVLVLLGSFVVPSLQDPAVQDVVMVVLMGLATPVLSRWIGYKDRSALMSVMLARVRRRHEVSWRLFSGAVADAVIMEEDFGLGADGTEYDLRRMRPTGRMVRSRDTSEQSRAVYEKVVKVMRDLKKGE